MAGLQSRYRRLESRARTWLVLSLVAIALAMTGFAHRAMPAGDSGNPPAEAFYVLPDGSVLDVCINGGDDHSGHGGACDFCRIASSSHSLDGLPVLAAIRLKPAPTVPQQDEAVPVLLAGNSNPARAPPFA